MADPCSFVHLWSSIEEILCFCILKLFLPFRPFSSLYLEFTIYMELPYLRLPFSPVYLAYRLYLILASSEFDAVGLR